MVNVDKKSSQKYDVIVVGGGFSGLYMPVSYTHLTLPTNREV